MNSNTLSFTAAKGDRQMKLMNRKLVQQTTGLSRSTIYMYMAEGNFPRPIKIGLRAVRWSSVEVGDWIEQKFRVRDDGS